MEFEYATKEDINQLTELRIALGLWPEMEKLLLRLLFFKL